TTRRTPVTSTARVVTPKPSPSLELRPCRKDEAVCHNKQCIPREYVCDGERDCRDGSDELNCGESPGPQGRAVPPTLKTRCPKVHASPLVPPKQGRPRLANPTSSSAETATAPSNSGAAMGISTAWTGRMNWIAVSDRNLENQGILEGILKAHPV
uniref:Uncharacterized protein n=1 Tax=Anolis carolinensis TaxID=28377 RepID=H9GVN2_ANOCA